MVSSVQQYVIDLSRPRNKSSANIVAMNRSISSDIKAECSLNNMRKSVSFNQIHVRQYVLDLGDNPSCSKGPPLAMSWNYDDIGSVDLEEFEKNRPTRRHSENLIMPLATRLSILSDIGYSPLQIMKAIDDVKTCQQQRMKSAKALSTKFDVLLEKANKKMRQKSFRTS